jgi:hypothetical protein
MKQTMILNLQVTSQDEQDQTQVQNQRGKPQTNLEIRNIKKLQLQALLTQKLNTKITNLHTPLQTQPLQSSTPNNNLSQPNITDT